jgi:hypothetical protein
MSKDLARHRERGMSFLEGGEGDPFLFLHGIPVRFLAPQSANAHTVPSMVRN